MSIYPVLLSEWFPFGDGKYETTLSLVKHMRCVACRRRPRYKDAVGHHSLPWGHGDLWCSWECCNSGKIAKVDKRRYRSESRRYGQIWGIIK